jgi:hypothetical protein
MAQERKLFDGKHHRLEGAVAAICEDVVRRIQRRDLALPPVQYQERVDGMNGKVRNIGIEPIIQQVIEHVADGCLSELWKKKFCYCQFASVKGKGQVKGAKLIQKWTKEALEKPTAKMPPRYARYFVKLDVRQCYPSMKREMIMRLLQRDIGKNKTLLWLVDAILQHHGDGLIIGSPLSQSLCNYVMSYACRYVMDLSKTRRGKRVRLVSRSLFWMDDILLMGSDRRNVLSAARKLSRFLSVNFGMEIKPNYHVKDHNVEPIDMMGFVVYGSGKIKIRKKIFIRARQAFAKPSKKPPTVKMARRVCAYYGYFKHSDTQCCIPLASGTAVNTKAVKMRMCKLISDRDKEENQNVTNSEL